jgi:hypothetical protein
MDSPATLLPIQCPQHVFVEQSGIPPGLKRDLFLEKLLTGKFNSQTLNSPDY